MVRVIGLVSMIAFLTTATPFAMDGVAAGAKPGTPGGKTQVIKYVDVASLERPDGSGCSGTQSCSLDCESYIIIVIGIPDDCYCFSTTGWSMDIICTSRCPDYVIYCTGGID